MSNIQDGVSQYVLEKFFKLISTASTSAQSITDFVEWLCERSDNKKMLNRIEECIEQGNNQPVNCVTALDFSFDDLSKKFEEKEILHAAFIDKNTSVRYFMYLKEDEQRVRDAVNEIYAEQLRTSEFSLYDFNRMHMGETPAVFKDIDEVQMKLFRENAKNNNIVFSTTLNEEGLYDITVSQNKIAETEHLLKKTNALTTGITGEKIKSEIMQNVNCLKNTRELARQSKPDFYIVSALNPNNYIHVSPDGYEHIKVVKGTPKIIRKEHSKANDNFINNLSIQSYELSKPIIVKPEEFKQNDVERNILVKEKYDEMIKKDIVKNQIKNKINKCEYPIYVVSSTNTNNFIKIDNNTKDINATLLDVENIEKPITLTESEFNKRELGQNSEKMYNDLLKNDSETKRLQYLEMEARRLVELKFSLDNNEQVENISSFYNNDVKFDEFFEHELVNENHSQEELERISMLEKEFHAMSDDEREYIKKYIQEFDEKKISYHIGDEITEDSIENIETLDQRIDRCFSENSVVHDDMLDDRADEHEEH